MLPTTVHARLDINRVEHILAYTHYLPISPSLPTHTTESTPLPTQQPTLFPIFFWVALSLLFFLDIHVNQVLLSFFFFHFFFFMVGKIKKESN